MSLEEDESKPFLKYPTSLPPRSSRLRSNLDRITSACPVSHLILFVATSLFWACILFPVTKWPDHNKKQLPGLLQPARLLDCGTTLDEAKVKGCKYGILANHWVPEPCMDHQHAIEESQSDWSWFGFADAEHTKSLTIDDMGDTTFYWTNMRDHIVHCAMLWRKQYRAVALGRTHVDSIIADVTHTTHCSQFLIDMSDKGPDFRKQPIKVWVGYAQCLELTE